MGTRANKEKRSSTDPTPFPAATRQLSHDSAMVAKLSVAHHYNHAGLSPPRKASERHPVSSLAGQLFLCAIGMLLSLAVCIWLAAFSTDVRWRRMLFALAAAVCAGMFTLLAVSTVKKNRRWRTRSHSPPLHGLHDPLLRAQSCYMAGSPMRRSTPNAGLEIRRQSYTGGEDPKPLGLAPPSPHQQGHKGGGHLQPIASGVAIGGGEGGISESPLVTVNVQDYDTTDAST